MPVIMAILAREKISKYWKRDKTIPARPESPLYHLRMAYIPPPPPPDQQYHDVDDTRADALGMSLRVGTLGVPTSAAGFERHLAYHCEKRDKHMVIIEDLKKKRKKVDTEPVDSDDEQWDEFYEIFPVTRHLTCNWDSLKRARDAARGSNGDSDGAD